MDDATRARLTQARRMLHDLLDIIGDDHDRGGHQPVAADHQGHWWRTPATSHDGPGVLTSPDDGGRFIYLTGPLVRGLGFDGGPRDAEWAPLRADDARQTAYALLAAADHIDPPPDT